MSTEREGRMEEALHRILRWSETSPFLLLEATMMRHVIAQVGHIAKVALDDDAHQREMESRV